VPLAYNSVAAEQDFWTEHWGGQSLGNLLAIARTSPLIDLITASLSARGRVLAAGCGLGQYVLLLRERGWAAVGMDWSQPALAACRRLTPAPLAATELRALAVRDGAFAAYVSLGVVEHDPAGLDAILAEARRALESGGVALVSVPYLNGARRAAAPWIMYRNRAIRRRGGRFYQYAFSRRELVAALARHGFVVRSAACLRFRAAAALAILPAMTEPSYRLVDLGDRRVLTVDGREHSTRYSERVIRMLIERKGVRRAPPYFAYKETRGRHFLGPLFRYLRSRGARGLSVLEIGCSFGHITEYVAEHPEVGALYTFDTDSAFVAMTRAKVEELGLARVREVAQFSNDATRRLPYEDGRFDLVLAVGVVEHLPLRNRRAQVDEYYRVLARGGHIAILDTPNRLFPLETHSVGLPLIQWLPPRLAYRYARLGRPRKFADVTYEGFVADGTGWVNAMLWDCLPSSGRRGLLDVTEEAGYGWRFFCDTARSRTRRAVLPAFALLCGALKTLGQPPSLCLPYLNLLFRKL
jgi:SAM-dependent methyltransferase